MKALGADPRQSQAHLLLRFPSSLPPASLLRLPPPIRDPNFYVKWFSGWSGEKNIDMSDHKFEILYSFIQDKLDW